MAQTLTCDICHAEPGVQMLSNLADGSTMVLGGQCLPVFYGQSLALALEAGQHNGAPTKCAACRATHAHMLGTIDGPPTEPDTAVAEPPLSDNAEVAEITP